MSTSLVPVILAGGVGSRLWPISRECFPKSLLPLWNNKTLFQNTIDRIIDIEAINEIYVASNESHRFMIKDQLKIFNTQKKINILLEPEARDTAPAIALVALDCLHKEKDPILLILPSDHVIQDHDGFNTLIKTALECIKKNDIICFGVVPNTPDSAYGYIRAAQKSNESQKIYPISEFIEKPNLEEALKLVADENVYWNSGIFMFHASTYINALNQHAQEIKLFCQEAILLASRTTLFIIPESHSFKKAPKLSIDYAVMEHVKNAFVIPMNLKWLDIGSWNNLWTSGSKDENNNVISGNVHASHVANSYLQSTGRYIVAIGVKDTIVVETKDAVLVANKENAQDVKNIVNQIKAIDSNLVSVHTRVYRPWGFYETLSEGKNYRVKHLIVNPGERLSLQLHHHREEHWVVVNGFAKIFRDEETIELGKGEYTFIKKMMKHRLANETSELLEVIEVQLGSYLGEDDIVRFEDIYERDKVEV